MNNGTQLVITIVSFVLGLLTFAANYIEPISDKIDKVNERLYRVEGDIRVIQTSQPKKP